MNISDMHLRVGLILLDQFTIAAFAGFVDALRLAADLGGRSRQIDASWCVMSASGARRRSSSGVLVEATEAFRDPTEFDYLAVCGGNGYREPCDPSVLDYLRLAAAKRIRLLGICTGTFAIAEAGLVGDRRVCVHWNVLDVFQERFPGIAVAVDHIFVDEGDLITCAGSTAAIDLALHLVERHCGSDKARQAMRHMMLHGVRPASLPQAHFYVDLGPIRDLRLRQAVHYLEQRLDDPPSVGEIAAHVGISTRQLERVFHAALGTSPASFQRKLRLDYARWLLVHSRRSITEIALDCGFSDTAHFSREFRARFALPPREFRRSMSIRADARVRRAGSARRKNPVEMLRGEPVLR